jgi:hypothetical protein
MIIIIIIIIVVVVMIIVKRTVFYYNKPIGLPKGLSLSGVRRVNGDRRRASVPYGSPVLRREGGEESNEKTERSQ